MANHSQIAAHAGAFGRAKSAGGAAAAFEQRGNFGLAARLFTNTLGA